MRYAKKSFKVILSKFREIISNNKITLSLCAKTLKLCLNQALINTLYVSHSRVTRFKFQSSSRLAQQSLTRELLRNQIQAMAN